MTTKKPAKHYAARSEFLVLFISSIARTFVPAFVLSGLTHGLKYVM